MIISETFLSKYRGEKMKDTKSDFYYYSFILNGKERIYYSYVYNDSEEEILEWAENFGFIEKSDIPKCKNVRELSPEEVEQRNKVLYQEWFKKREEKLAKGEYDFSVPPTIGEVQLN